MSSTRAAPSDVSPTLASLISHLRTTHLVPAPQKPHSASLTARIASLRLHPTLEVTLHILNNDLPSAHFLVRHMQAPPAVEGMLLHGILHRCEGDFDNARAWLGDVGDACAGWVPKKKAEGARLEGAVFEGTKGGQRVDESLVEFVYGEGGIAAAMDVVDDVERVRRKGGGVEELEGRARGEMEGVLEWCRVKFGDGEWADASSAWVKNSEEVQEMSNDMVSGDKGWRKF